MIICCLYQQGSFVCICTVLLYVEERLLFCEHDLKYVGISLDKCSENGKFIGASLSEPHTSVTLLRTCVCMLACLLGPTTYQKF